MLRINTNVAAFNTLRDMRSMDGALSRSMEKLSSGLRINRASDDAAGLSISEVLNTQVRGSQRAAQNLQDGISLVNTAEGALNEMHAILQRMRELAVEASNGTLTATDRQSTDQEFQALKAEIGNIAVNTTFNGVALFSGVAGGFSTSTFTTTTTTGASPSSASFTLTGPAPPLAPSAVSLPTINVMSTNYPSPPNPIPIAAQPTTLSLAAGDYSISQTQVGLNGTTPLYSYTVTLNNATLNGTGPYTLSAPASMTYPTSTLPLQIQIQAGANFGDTETISIPPVNAGSIGVANNDLTTQAKAAASIQAVQNAIAQVSSIRDQLGSTSNALQHTHDNELVTVQNQMAAYSRIRDADMATQMTGLTREQILMQSSTRMLKFANDSPEHLLTLLSG